MNAPKMFCLICDVTDIKLDDAADGHFIGLYKWICRDCWRELASQYNRAMENNNDAPTTSLR